MSVAGGRFREMILGMRDCDRISLVVVLCDWFKMLVARGQTEETSCLTALKKLRKDIMRLRGGSLIHSEVWALFEYAPEDSQVFFHLDKVGFDVNKLDPCWTKHYYNSVGGSYSAREEQMMQDDGYDAFLEERSRSRSRDKPVLSHPL